MYAEIFLTFYLRSLRDDFSNAQIFAQELFGIYGNIFLATMLSSAIKLISASSFEY